MLPHVEPPRAGHGCSTESSFLPSTDSSFSSFQPATHGINGRLSSSPSSSSHGPQSDGPSHRVHYTSPSPFLPATASDGFDHSSSSVLDLICVGFGPASLAIAVALHDALAAGQTLLPDGSAPRVLFIEKQHHFAWHAGMLLPGAKMQISFIKDLATLRDPRSEFTFLNYLHRNGRLVDFTNLGTFLPARVEYEDYLRWSASHFRRQVKYGNEVLSISPEPTNGAHPVQTFAVQSRDVKTGLVRLHRGRNVLVATGGQPSFPANFPEPGSHPGIIHSSQFAYLVPRLLPNNQSPCRVAVVGAGQSAAEIFRNTQKLYPHSKTYLIMRQEFLRPSDDSPFVNSVFDPDYIDTHFSKPAQHREQFLGENRATNYGVVRLELIEQLYETMYHQKLELGPDERAWPHRILGQSHITGIAPSSAGTLQVKIQRLRQDQSEEGDEPGDATHETTIEVDLLIAATGYRRDAHVTMLKDTWDMLPEARPDKEDFSRGVQGWAVQTKKGPRELAVGRDYKVKFAPGAVEPGSGVWLQGCCEGTHGLSDTLLSVLATRSGETVNSIFGRKDGS